MDPCIFLGDENGKLVGLPGLKVDASLILATKAHLDIEAITARKLKLKSRVRTGEKPFEFNGAKIGRKDGGTVIMQQVDKINRLVMLSTQKWSRVGERCANTSV